MTISALPAAPSRSDTPADFIAKADAFVAALATFRTEANALAVAMNLNATTDTSASSVAIGTGSKSFTVSAGKSFQPGMWLNIADTAAPSTNSMHGQITSYNSGTGALVVNVTSIIGSGTKTAWTISQSAPGDATQAGNNTFTGSNSFTGNMLQTGSGGLGFGTGAGGSVTQLTSKSTAVTLNKASGQIGTHNAALAAGASVTFQVNNSTVAGQDHVAVSSNATLAGAINNYRIQAGSVGTGNFYIHITNISAGSLSESLIINFEVIKGATA